MITERKTNSIIRHLDTEGESTGLGDWRNEAENTGRME